MTITFKVCENIKKEEIKLLNDFTLDHFIKFQAKKENKKEFKPRYTFDIKNDNEFLKSKIKYDKLVNDSINSKKVLKSSILQNNEGNENELKQVNPKNINSFIYSAWEAYNNHWHLELRPDDIWFSIITQFSFYLNKNSELLRDKFVDFQDKKELIVRTDGPILEAPFDLISIKFSNQISENIKDPLIKDWVIPNFSTTTSIDKVSFSIALMSSLKNYFDFTAITKCCLPEVTLNGTTEDWINLKERITQLLQFNLEETNEIKKWVDYLLPVADKFIESSKGNPDIDWWNKIVDYKSQSGVNVLSGWLSVFCVFNDKGEYRDDYSIMGNKKYFDGCPWPRVSGDKIPSGYLSAPIKLIDADNTYESNIYSGHFGSKLNNDNTKITPSIDWFIIANLPTQQHSKLQWTTVIFMLLPILIIYLFKLLNKYL